MAIKGITIPFEGDTKDLEKSIKNLNKDMTALDRELRTVNNALKFNPTSVELWRQKQQILTSKISDTEKKLELLKKQQQDMDARGIDKNSAEYRKLQREIVTTESKVKTFKAQVKGIGNVNLRAVSEQFKEVGNKLTAAGQAMKGFSAAGAAVAATLGALAVKSSKAADDINTMSKKYHIAAGDLQMYKAAADLTDVSVESIAKSHVKLEKQMASAANGGKSASQYFNQLGVSVTNADGSLRNADEVWQEAIKALGNIENETQRDAIAMGLMGKAASDLNPLIEDGGETYTKLAETMQKYNLNFIDQETLDKANQFNDELDTMKAVGSVALQTIGSKLAEVLLPALQKLGEFVGKIAEWISTLDPHIVAVVGGIALVIAGIAPLLILLGKIAFAISSITGLMSTLGISFAAIAGPIGIAIAVIAALIAIGVLLYKNWDKIKAAAKALLVSISSAWTSIKQKITTTVTNIITSVTTAFNNLKTTVSNIFTAIRTTATNTWNSIKTAITRPIESAKEKVQGIISKIKSFFPISIGNILKNVKLPHFKWHTKDVLGKIKIPVFDGIDWYDKGGIFNKPSIIGVSEKRPEFVGALDDLRKIVREESGSGNIQINVYASPGMDVKELASEVERRLINSTNRRRLAW